MTDNQFHSPDLLAKQLADELAKKMDEVITTQGQVTIAVSGGSTPVGFFQQLSSRPLDWSKVSITLVDERWVSVEDVASNARLVRDQLLQNQAKQARFLPLNNDAPNPVDGFAHCENSLHRFMEHLDFAVLGMGNDGHTASWFADSSALPKCLDQNNPNWCCPVTDAPGGLARITLTWSLLSQCRHLYLHFEGAEKNAVFEQARAAQQRDRISAMPIRAVIFQTQVPLSIYRSEP